MFFSFAAALFATSAAALVSAQGNGTTHNVVVGGQAGLVFTPASITAAAGDIVTFEFQTKNHTVTQSSFATPCKLLENATSNQVGFDSGYVPVSANATEFPAWSIQVTDAKTPIWFYCKQTGHCAQGMVGAINAPTSGPKTFDAFSALAKGSANDSTPAAPGAGTSVSAGGADGVGASASGSVSGGSDPAATAAAANDGGSADAAGSVKVASTGLALSLVAAVTILFA